MTRCASSRRSTPLSTKMQVSWSPTARWMSAAVTVESTPPLRPQTTPAAPTRARMRSVSRSMKFSIVQSALAWQMRKTKFSSSSRPRGVCATSGWN